MAGKHPHYRPQIDSKTLAEIDRNIDAYYAKHKKKRKHSTTGASVLNSKSE